MQQDHLKITDGASAGAWIRPRLEGEFGMVTLQVPKGYEAYARVFHPASDSEGNPVRWAEVANVFDSTVHQKMQWHAILGLSDADELCGSYGTDTAVGSKWEGSDPPTGAMDLEALDALCEILVAHTADPERCFFGLCTIQNWSDSFLPEDLKPLLKLPWDRDHIVLVGPLSAVDQIVYDWSKSRPDRVEFAFRRTKDSPSADDASGLQSRESPNLIWPADHSWFVASEVDFDSTLVGGDAKLIKAVVESSKLEAWQVAPTDSLAADADKINVA